MNGMQIPTRTSSAPPNLDKQKRDQYQQPSIPLQFGAPGAQMQSQSVTSSSLQIPMPLPVGNTTQVRQQVFVSGLQPHPLQPQGMLHQGQSLGFAPQICVWLCVPVVLIFNFDYGDIQFRYFGDYFYSIFWLD